MRPDAVMMVYVSETTYAPELVYGIRRDVQSNHGVMHVELFDKTAFSVDCAEDVLMRMAKSFGRYVKRHEEGNPYKPERFDDRMELVLHTCVGTRIRLTARWEEQEIHGLDSVQCVLRDAEDAVKNGDVSYAQAAEAVKRACDASVPFAGAVRELGYAKGDANPDMETEFFRCVAEMGRKALDPACFDELVQRVMEACSVKPAPSCLEAYVKRMLKIQEK